MSNIDVYIDNEKQPLSISLDRGDENRTVREVLNDVRAYVFMRLGQKNIMKEHYDDLFEKGCVQQDGKDVASELMRNLKWDDFRNTRLDIYPKYYMIKTLDIDDEEKEIFERVLEKLGLNGKSFYTYITNEGRIYRIKLEKINGDLNGRN